MEYLDDIKNEYYRCRALRQAFISTNGKLQMSFNDTGKKKN